MPGPDGERGTFSLCTPSCCTQNAELPWQGLNSVGCQAKRLILYQHVAQSKSPAPCRGGLGEWRQKLRLCTLYWLCDLSQ